MPRNNSPARRTERRLTAVDRQVERMRQSRNPLERVISAASSLSQGLSEDELNGHFAGHLPGCTMLPSVCQATHGR